MQNNKAMRGAAQKILVCLLLCVVLTTYFGCYKKSPTASYLLTDEMKNQNPFYGGEKLHFISDSSVQYVLDGGERQNKVHEVSNGSDGGYHLLEENYISFFLTSHYRIRMDMLGRSNEYKISFSYYNFGGIAYFDLPLSKENTQTVDSLFVMDQWHYDVFVYEGENINNDTYKLYYSTDFGVVKIDFSDGSWWELEKIEW